MSEAPSGHPLPVELERLLHDIRGTLNAVRMHLELLKRAGAADDATRASVTTIEQELARLAVQLPAAFAVAAVERGAAARVNLRTVVETALREHDLGPVTIADVPWPDVYADAGLVALAVAHLVRNAVNASQAVSGNRPVPRLNCITTEREATVVVRDWGRGLRSTNPRSLIRLTGADAQRAAVGLLTVERIARLHGGKLEFATPPDGGAEVRLTLPRP